MLQSNLLKIKSRTKFINIYTLFFLCSAFELSILIIPHGLLQGIGVAYKIGKTFTINKLY